MLKVQRGVREGGDEVNGPKRRVSRRLGHWYVFFFFFCIFSILTNVSRLYSTRYVIERARMIKTRTFRDKNLRAVLLSKSYEPLLCNIHSHG